MALRGHLCLLLYVVALIAALVVLAGVFVLVDGGDGMFVVQAFAGGALGAVCLIAGRRGEKYAAKYLIREHLRRISRSDPENTGQA